MTRHPKSATAGRVVPERQVQAAAIRMLEGFGCVVHRRNTGALTAEHNGKSQIGRAHV